VRAILNSHGPQAAAELVPDEVLERYAIVGDQASVTARLAELCQDVGPELLVFDAADYSIEYLESVAALARHAGAVALHHPEALYGLDSHD
jgi:hypothetical protein